ncbi:MAG TPA: universal stress protein [Planctomicrobium sp.]|nr:universal stress protein [Planctomicrobium sp.]
MKILLGVDGSHYSDEAIRFVSRFPFPVTPDIVLVHACLSPDYTYSEFGIPVDMTHLMDLARKEGERILAEASKKCESWANSVKTELLFDAVPGQAIVKAATKNNVDLIVAGARGMGAVERFLIGSVSEAIVKYSPCSTLIVRPLKREAANNDWKILIADDDSIEANQGIQRIAESRFHPDSQLRLMTVLNTFHEFHAEFTLQQGPELTMLLEKTQHRLNRKAESLKETTAVVTTLIKESPDASKRILSEAEQFKPDLIVIGSTGKSGWKRAILGSVSHRVLHHSVCSVLIERKRPGVQD